MFTKSVFVIACVVVVLVASMRRAHADPSPRAFLAKPLPPAPVDRKRPSGFAAALERLLASCRSNAFATRERGAESLGRDAATSLGARPRNVHLTGLSLAAIGAGTWAASQRGGGAPPVVTIGPRLYSGGGGVGVSVRW